MFVLGFTLQAYKACACPVSRLKKDPRVSDRDISGLMDEVLTHLKLGPGVTPCHVWQMRGKGKDMGAVFATGRKVVYQL